MSLRETSTARSMRTFVGLQSFWNVLPVSDRGHLGQTVLLNSLTRLIGPPQPELTPDLLSSLSEECFLDRDDRDSFPAQLFSERSPSHMPSLMHDRLSFPPAIHKAVHVFSYLKLLPSFFLVRKIRSILDHVQIIVRDSSPSFIIFCFGNGTYISSAYRLL